MLSRVTPATLAVLTADGDDFVTRSVPSLMLTPDGIAGDRHAGRSRAADARTPWHRRGTPIANTRQLSLVSAEECEAIAHGLRLAGAGALRIASLLGANILLSGIAGFSQLAAGTRLLFPSGAVVFITEQNMPCLQPGRRIAASFGEPGLAERFRAVATGRRGVVALVEREGVIAAGDAPRCRRPRIAVPLDAAEPDVPVGALV